MTIHSHITNIHSFTILLLFVLFVGYAQSASAQAIDVDYGGGPLFSEADFLPGDTVERSFMVENLWDVEQEVPRRTLDESDTGLAEVVQVGIERAGGILYFEDTLEQLFGEDYVSLGMVNPGATVEFTMGATFLPDSGNGYQGGTAGFAVCVGFAGENENCVADTEPGGYAQGSYGGGGGGGGGSGGVGVEEEVGKEIE